MVFVENIKNEEDGLKIIRRVGYEDYRVEEKAWTTRVFEHTKQRRFKRNPNEYLNNIEVKWRQHN